MRYFLIGYFLFSISCLRSQTMFSDSCDIVNEILDSLYILETETAKGSDKILHAEPLFIDLIRDLGARKGEKEWNVGLGMIDKKYYDRYIALIEYEFAPINRLGLEIELPFSFHYPVEKNNSLDEIPGNKLNSIKMAAQYSFIVNEKLKTSLAAGYIHEFELPAFKQYGKSSAFSATIYNPFFIIAKRWSNNFHTLLYTGPLIEQDFKTNHTTHHWQINTNIHYMISGTRNFIGCEFNKELNHLDFDMVVRPQMRLSISNNLLVGIVAGVPVKRENQRFSTFMRLIYEPGHKTHSKRFFNTKKAC